MYIGANELALTARLVQLIIFSALAILSIRDLLRGENGTTPGLVVLSAGLVITNLLGLFVTVTIHPYSPAGVIELGWNSETYLSIVSGWHALGSVTTAWGAGMLSRYVWKANVKSKSTKK